MIEIDEIPQNINMLLFSMASLSPKVKEAIERETYRLSADSDGSTDQYILEDCFLNLNRDLSEIGVVVNIDYNDYIHDLMKLTKFIHLSGYFLPNSLYPMLKTNRKLKQLIIDISTGSLGEGEKAIHTYLNELGGLNDLPALVPNLQDFIDEIYLNIDQTELFSDYLKNILIYHDEEVLTDTHDVDRYHQYQHYTRELIGRLSDAVNQFEEDIEFKDLAFLQRIFIHELLSPSNFTDYSYLFLENKDTLPDDLHKRYDRKWYQFYVSHPGFYDYYQLRNIEPTLIELMFIYCTAYAFNTTSTDFDNAVRFVKDKEKNLYIHNNVRKLYTGS